jgi:hypothetical protein
MRIKTLPATVKEKLGISSKKQEAAYLKKVQELYCDRMTYHDLCPMQCWRCTRNLDNMADQMPPDAPIAFWHTTVQSTMTSIVEEVHEVQEEAPVLFEAPRFRGLK